MTAHRWRLANVVLLSLVGCAVLLVTVARKPWAFTAFCYILLGSFVARIIGYYLAPKYFRARVSHGPDEDFRACKTYRATQPLSVAANMMLVVLMCYAVLGLILGLWHASGPWDVSHVPFPLSHVSDLAVDREGRIYVALVGDNRIQAYADDGAFTHGFFIPSNGGHIELAIDSGGSLVIRTRRPHAILTYDRFGRLLNSAPDVDRAEFKRKTSTIGMDGRRYILEDELINPKICRYEINGEKSLEIRGPVVLLPLAAPFHLKLLMVVTFACLIIVHFRRRKRQHGLGSE